MKYFFRKTKGETILETVIAMAILASGIMISSAIIGASIRNMNASKNRIIAVNIAREGIEAMRNIRDTNWLKYKHKIRQCWNYMPPQNPSTVCGGTMAETIPAGTFIIYKQDTGRWRLEENKIVPDLTPLAAPSDVIDNAQLYLVDIDPLIDTDGDHDYINDQDAYNHAATESNDGLGKEYPQKTLFKRTLTIEYLANNGNLLDTGVPSADYNRMRITARVVWQDGKNKFETQLTTHITDYLDRESLSG